MSKYRIEIPVTFIIEINDDNEAVDGPPALQGHSLVTAKRRAMWALFHNLTKDAQRRLGVKYIITKEKGTTTEELE